MVVLRLVWPSSSYAVRLSYPDTGGGGGHLPRQATQVEVGGVGAGSEPKSDRQVRLADTWRTEEQHIALDAPSCKRLSIRRWSKSEQAGEKVCRRGRRDRCTHIECTCSYMDCLCRRRDCRRNGHKCRRGRRECTRQWKRGARNRHVGVCQRVDCRRQRTQSACCAEESSLSSYRFARTQYGCSCIRDDCRCGAGGVARPCADFRRRGVHCVRSLVHCACRRVHCTCARVHNACGRVHCACIRCRCASGPRLGARSRRHSKYWRVRWTFRRVHSARGRDHRREWRGAPASSSERRTEGALGDQGLGWCCDGRAWASPCSEVGVSEETSRGKG